MYSVVLERWDFTNDDETLQTVLKVWSHLTLLEALALFTKVAMSTQKYDSMLTDDQNGCAEIEWYRQDHLMFDVYIKFSED